MALLLLQTVKDDGEAGQWLVTAHPEQNDEFHKYKLLSTVMAITISPYPPPACSPPVSEREKEYNGSLTHRWVFGEERQGQSVYVSTPVAERWVVGLVAFSSPSGDGDGDAAAAR
jgi:hypothetical protein